MSGITPILDTLLHQVLGKRVDNPSPKVLNEPVKPMTPSEAPRALHSDSRLDARQTQLTPLGGAAARETPQEGTPAARQGQTPASTTTQFSPAARSIADILVKFPAPPSALSPSAPLMSPSGESASPTQVASSLQASINESGLFYESHLGRWFRGELSRQALEREPQMLMTRAQRPAPNDFAALGSLRPVGSAQASPPAPLTPPDANTVTRLLPLLDPASTGGRGERGAMASSVSSQMSPATPTPLSSTPSIGQSGPVAANQGAASGQAAWSPSDIAMADMASRSAITLQEPVNEALQSVVRHQLEMLVTPVLRWEGDVWTGIFMALLVHVPEPTDQRYGREEEGEHGQKEDDAPPWRSDITLRLPHLGELSVSMRLAGERLTMTLASPSADVVRSLEMGQGDLRSRLEACGFDEVLLRTHLSNLEGTVE